MKKEIIVKFIVDWDNNTIENNMDLFCALQIASLLKKNKDGVRIELIKEQEFDYAVWSNKKTKKKTIKEKNV
jgi:hypothetical protein